MPEIKVYKPSEALKPYVRYYWVLDCIEKFRTLTFPIGCPQMIFHKKSPLYIPEINCHQNEFTISGQVNYPAHIASSGPTQMIVAVFYPHTISHFISTPPSAFYNLEISGYDIGNRQLNDIASKILDCDDIRTCISLLDTWLIGEISSSAARNRISHTISTILENPSELISILANEVCLGKKQFERTFREHVGMNPKEYARIVRFQKVLWHLQHSHLNFPQISHDCGYADQSHMIREFKTFSGNTPTALLTTVTPYSDLFTTPT